MDGMNGRFQFKDLFVLLKETFKEWNEDEPFYLSAGVAYYALLALPGLLVLVINIAGSIWEKEEVKSEISVRIEEVMGANSANQVETIMTRAMGETDSTLATLFSIGTLVFGATGVFFMLQRSLNKVWDVKVKPKSGILHMVKSRAVGLGLILVIGFLLLISLLLTTALSVLSEWIRANLPEFLFYSFYAINFVVSVGVITLLFAVIYKFLPDVIIGWKTLWIGSLFTALLFVLGKELLGLYFGNANPGSAYGVAGSMVVIMLWVSYSCLLIFFGAEFTQVYARRYGQRIKPAKHAYRLRKELFKEEEG